MTAAGSPDWLGSRLGRETGRTPHWPMPSHLDRDARELSKGGSPFGVFLHSL